MVSTLLLARYRTRLIGNLIPMKTPLETGVFCVGGLFHAFFAAKIAFAHFCRCHMVKSYCAECVWMDIMFGNTGYLPKKCVQPKLISEISSNGVSSG